MNTRGSFIVLEGVDRSGKSTQCKKLVEKLKENQRAAELIRFPDRTTNIGKQINEYLTKSMDLPDQVIHLLFSANRWELEPTIRKHLMNGVNLIVDRYSFSGVAYSAAKKTNNMDLEWCKNPETGLPKPDCVIYLELEQKLIKDRKCYGEERYEHCEFQKEVSKCFVQLQDDSWKVIDANKSIEDLNKELYEIIEDVIKKSKHKPILTLW